MPACAAITNVIANLRAACDSCPGDNDAMFPDHNVVRNLHQVVDLGALANPCASKPRSIHRAAGPDLNVIIDLHDARLTHFAMAAIRKIRSQIHRRQ